MEYSINFLRFEDLIKKVNQLKIKYLELIDENRYLKMLLTEKEKELEKQNNLVKDLENQYKISNLATQTGVSENQRKYIEKLLEEIDACLSLLET